eukprot:scaffold6631_cov61-Phaeocystis_antarctica.AAC.8
MDRALIDGSPSGDQTTDDAPARLEVVRNLSSSDCRFADDDGVRRTSLLIPVAIAGDPDPCAGTVGSGFHCTPLLRRTVWWSEVGRSADVCMEAESSTRAIFTSRGGSCREAVGSALGDRSGCIFAHMRPDLQSLTSDVLPVSDFRNEAAESALRAHLKDALALLGLNVS